MSNTDLLDPPFSHAGYCEICGKDVTFVAHGRYFRNTLRCPVCNTAPRNRATFHVLQQFFPAWRTLTIHESSPSGDSMSNLLKREAAQYIETQWDLSIPFGTVHPRGHRSEDLQAQTFADGTIDLMIAQDVFEHVFEPDRAIAEIARTLRDGGACIITTPLVMKKGASRRRASLVDGSVVHHLEPEYHGNPVNKEGRLDNSNERSHGSLVTVDWGYDIVPYLQRHSGLSVMLLSIDNIDLGIRADLNEVIVGFKRPLVVL